MGEKKTEVGEAIVQWAEAVYCKFGEIESELESLSKELVHLKIEVAMVKQEVSGTLERVYKIERQL